MESATGQLWKEDDSELVGFSYLNYKWRFSFTCCCYFPGEMFLKNAKIIQSEGIHIDPRNPLNCSCNQ